MYAFWGMSIYIPLFICLFFFSPTLIIWLEKFVVYVYSPVVMNTSVLLI